MNLDGEAAHFLVVKFKLGDIVNSTLFFYLLDIKLQLMNQVGAAAGEDGASGNIFATLELFANGDIDQCAVFTAGDALGLGHFGCQKGRIKYAVVDLVGAKSFFLSQALATELYEQGD